MRDNHKKEILDRDETELTTENRKNGRRVNEQSHTAKRAINHPSIIQALTWMASGESGPKREGGDVGIAATPGDEEEESTAMADKETNKTGPESSRKGTYETKNRIT